MSHNQSRAERSDSAQYKRTGRCGSSNQQRQFQGSASSKGGGGAPFNNANRGYNKNYNSNAPQGGPSRVRNPNVDSDSAGHAVHNGPQEQQTTHRAFDATISRTSSDAKLADAPTQRTTQAVPRSPSSNVYSATPTSKGSDANPESAFPKTPAKGDASGPFPLQFGSISPGFMNGVQIPARTSSAPPNLDEQKRDQTCQNISRAAPSVPIPMPKQHVVKKDAGVPNLTNAGEVHSVSKYNRDIQFSTAPPVNQTQKSVVHSISGMPMQMPFYQQQVPVQFGGPNPQIQSQNMSGTSLPLPMQMPLPMGNPPMQQPMFIPSLQPHPLQSHRMMQGQNFNFPPQMTHQIPPQLGSMGINMTPQFPQQQTGKYGGSRKTVKITHPETHEELRLDGSPGPRSHHVVTPQSQPIPAFPPNHQMNFYTNSYSLSSSQVQPSQPPRFYNQQVTVKPPLGAHEKEPSSASSSVTAKKVDTSEPSRISGEVSVHDLKENQSSSLSSVPHSKPGLGLSSTCSASSSSLNSAAPASAPTNSVDPINISASILTSSANEARNEVVVHGQVKHIILSKPCDSGHQDQVGRHPPSLSSLTSQSSEAEPVNTIPALSGSSLACKVSKELQSTITTSSEAPNSVNGDRNFGTNSVENRQPEPEIIAEMEGQAGFHKQGLDTSLKSLSLEMPKIIGKVEETMDTEVTSSTGGLLGGKEEKPEESLGCRSDDVEMADNCAAYSIIGGENADSSESMDDLSAQDDKTSRLDTSLSEKTVTKCPDDALKPENEDIDNNSESLVSTSWSVKDKVLIDSGVAKSALPRGKKKKKDLYRKAEAAGTISDLYNAYKGPDEKKKTAVSAERAEKTSNNNIKQTSSEMSEEIDKSSEKPPLSKVEPDDWEDAAEIFPHLERPKNENQGSDVYGNELMTKRYSRDFLLKFEEQYIILPDGFEIIPEIDALLSRESYPSPGRNIDRPAGGSRPDRRAGFYGDDDKWNKFPGQLMPGRGDARADIGYAGNVGFRPGQVGNYGVLRNLRAQTPLQYIGGILSGPMQSLGPQGVLLRNNSDSDRWQRGTAFQKGLMPPPQTPPPVMHKAEKKYEIGKVTDEEQVKQRQLKGILNKLTPQNFEKLFQQVKLVNIDNVITLSGVISQIFDKALMEPTFCEMYADFCFHLAGELPELSVENEKITFKRLLLNECQLEFQKGEREEQEAKEAEEGESKQTEEEREEKRLRVRRRMLGNIRLIGELYKKKMLTERIMHECIIKLLGKNQDPDEENIEALCKLMSTIGKMIDHSKAKDCLDSYFDRMTGLSNNMKLSSRVRFLLRDAIDLRKDKWQQRRKVEGPKKIEDVHRDAAQERQAQTSRLSRVPSMASSNRRGPSMDFAPRTPSMLSSPGSQISSFRPGGLQLRGRGSQDVRTDERHSFENRTMSVPLLQRPVGEGSITLGPQGGLVRGMAFGGQPSVSGSRLAEISNPGDARRVSPGLNGFGSIPERNAHGQREDPMPRYGRDRLADPSSYDQERNITYGNRNTDRFDKFMPTLPAHGGPTPTAENTLSENMWSKEQLRDKSMVTIKEFYSARDENEVTLCIKDLNAPSFYPSMISIWLTDSFDRKDTERELLTKLLINLTKSRDGLISKDQFIQGFKSVLAVLEDAVNDAPRAAEFLGSFFARVILENAVSLSEIGRLIREGGEEQGSLVEAGIAAEVVGTILETIKSEKGEAALNEIRSSSNLQLHNFRAPGSNRSCRIDKFM